MNQPAKRLLTPQQQKINNDPAYWDHFDQWWDQDFSWDGLAKHKIENHPDGHSLQDYWREEEGRLIEFGGREWTRFHLPPHDQAGDVSDKFGVTQQDWTLGGWQSWRKTIISKLDQAKEYTPRPLTLLRSVLGDPRAQFQGVCFPAHFDLSENPRPLQVRTLHINADWSRFEDQANFNSVIFGSEVVFENAFFGTLSNFHKSHFSGPVWFSDARFGKIVNFGQVIFASIACYDRASFDEDAIFLTAKFNGETFFEQSSFDNNVNFTECSFGNGTSFKQATFSGQANFEHAVFGHEASFERTTFGKITSFHATKFGQLTKFLKSKFNGYVNFVDAEFEAGLSFKQAEFEGLAKFHGCKFHQDTSFAEAEFAVPGQGAGFWVDFWLKNHGFADTKLEVTTEQAEQYQRAFRALRQHMEDLRNHEQEMKFSRLEKKSQEQRTGSKDVPFSVRWLSRIYGFIADYGQSVWRPVIGLIVLFLVASVAYWLIAGDAASLSAAIALAFQYSLPPISTIASQFFVGEIDGIFTNALLDQPLLTRLVMTLHGLSSLALLFFLLLALKRRFQIS